MSFSATNQTNPVVIDATGYAPYIKARAERADAAQGSGLKANRRAQAIRDYWQKKDFVDQLVTYAKDHETNLFRNRWECEADRKNLYSRVRWEMDKITSEMDKDLERRKTRLTELLKAEEARYLEEMSMSLQEDPEVKKERMLKRYCDLKAQREDEREKIAEEKKDQQFKKNCDELRALVSQKIQRETAEEGKKIILEKEQNNHLKNGEDKLYAELWARDREAKDLKEAQEREAKKRRDVENKKFVQDQILLNHLEKQKKLRQKEHDAIVMEEQKRLAAIEDEYENELKKKKKEDLKRGLDECLRAKLKRRAHEVQDDLLQDLFFMKQIADENEDAAKSEAKQTLMQEQKQYLKYLEDQIKVEKEFEKEIDKAYKEELDKLWKKREQEWEEEKSKRRHLEKDVLDEVQEQIKYNLERNHQVQSYNRMFGQKIVEEDAKDKIRAAEKLRLMRERNIKNQKELLDQIRKKEDRLAEEKIRKDLELKMVQKERGENERKIQKLLSEMKIDNAHPFRTNAREIC